MNKTYLSVMSAYWSSWGFLGVSALFAFFLMISYPGADPQRLSAWPVLPILLTWSLFVLSFSGLTKEQFSTPHARLLPRFGRQHLAVAAVVSVLFCVMTAGVLSAVTSAQFFATCSVLAVMYAFIAWGVCLEPAILLVFAGLVYIFCCTLHVDLAMAILRGHNPITTLALLLLAIGWIILLGWKLSRLTEEDRAYSRRFWNPPSRWGALELSPNQQRALSRSWFIRAKERRLDEILSKPAPGLWANARRLREASGFAPPALIAMAVLAGSWIMSGLLTPGKPLSPQMAPVALLGILVSWRYASRALSQEAMRPVTRRDLLKQVGLIFLIDVMKFWFTVAVITALAWAMMSPELLMDGRAWRGLGIALCGIPLYVGVAGLALRIRSNLGFWTACMVIYAVAMAVVAENIHELFALATGPGANLWALTLIAGGVLASGALVCNVAYRVWLHADLG